MDRGDVGDSLPEGWVLRLQIPAQREASQAGPPPAQGARPHPVFHRGLCCSPHGP